MTSPTAPGFDFITEEELLAEQPKEPSMLEKGVRMRERSDVRIAERIAGLPGDLVQLIKSGASAVLGDPDPEEELTFAQKIARRGTEALPTSSELRDISSQVFPGLDPEDAAESFQDEVVGDFASLALPVGGKIPLAKTVGMALAGNIGKEAAAAFGGGDSAQEATKLGMMVFMGMFGKGRGINNHIKNLYKEADAFVPEGATVDYSGPLKRLGTLEKSVEKGAVDASTQPVLNMIEQIREKAPGGRMPVGEAVAFDRSINEVMGDPALLKRGKKLLGGVQGANSQALDTYAVENPSWGSTWKEAKQAYQGIAQSEKIQKYVRNNLSLRDYVHAGAMLGMEEVLAPMLGHSAVAGPALAGGAGAASVAYAGEVGRRIATNPALRRYYTNVMKASLSENKASLVRNMKGLDKAMKEEVESKPLEIFDFASES